jgi:hypothetical protein
VTAAGLSAFQWHHSVGAQTHHARGLHYTGGSTDELARLLRRLKAPKEFFESVSDSFFSPPGELGDMSCEYVATSWG